MNAASRLALFGAGLAVAFGGAYGIANLIAPDDAAQAWQQTDDMSEHSERKDAVNEHSEAMDDGNGHDSTSGGHEHPADGGAAPAGIRTATAPTYPVGTKVRLIADHMPGMDGAEATVSGAFATTTYSVTYTPATGGEPVVDHRWVVHEELENPGPAPLPVGTTVVLRAEHMPGMDGAAATIAGATQETVYMVDLEVGGMRITNHKWVVESEIRPLG